MKPVCERCNDTHRMTLAREGDSDLIVQCTACPVPCQKCRAGGRGAYCTELHCKCECHNSKYVAVPQDASSPTPTRLLMKELLELEARVTELRQRIGMSVLDWDRQGDSMSYYLEEKDLLKLLKNLNYAPKEAVTSEGEHQRTQEWLRSDGGSVVLRWQRNSLESSSPEYNKYILVQVGRTLEVLAFLERMEIVLLVARALAHHIAPVGSTSPDHTMHARTEAMRIQRPALIKLLTQLGWKNDAEVITPDTRTQRWWKEQPKRSFELTWKLVTDAYDFTDWEFQYTHSIEYIADAEGCTVDELVALAYAHHLERWGRFVQLRTTKKGFQATFMRDRPISHEYWGPSHPSPGKALRELGKEFDMKLAGDSFRAQR